MAHCAGATLSAAAAADTEGDHAKCLCGNKSVISDSALVRLSSKFFPDIVFLRLFCLLLIHAKTRNCPTRFFRAFTVTPGSFRSNEKQSLDAVLVLTRGAFLYFLAAGHAFHRHRFQWSEVLKLPSHIALWKGNGNSHSANLHTKQAGREPLTRRRCGTGILKNPYVTAAEGLPSLQI